MELEFQLDIKDFREFCKIVCKGLNKKTRLLSLLIIPFLVIFLLTSTVLFKVFSNYEFGVLSFLMGYIFCFLFFFLRGRIISKAAEPKNLNDFMTFQKHNYSETGLKVVTRTSETKYKWEHFFGFEESKNLYILLIEPSKGEVIPKRAFKDETQMEEFKKLCQEKIKPLEAST